MSEGRLLEVGLGEEEGGLGVVVTEKSADEGGGEKRVCGEGGDELGAVDDVKRDLETSETNELVFDTEGRDDGVDVDIGDEEAGASDKLLFERVLAEIEALVDEDDELGLWVIREIIQNLDGYAVGKVGGAVDIEPVGDFGRFGPRGMEKSSGVDAESVLF